MVQGLKKKSTNIPLPYSWFLRLFLPDFLHCFGPDETLKFSLRTEGKIIFAAQQIGCIKTAKNITTLQKLTAKKNDPSGSQTDIPYFFWSDSYSVLRKLLQAYTRLHPWAAKAKHAV